jgi:EpsI family protein
MKPNAITFLLILLLGCAGTFVLMKTNEVHPQKEKLLQSALNNLPHWTITGTIPVDDKIQKALELDEYLFQRYSNGQQSITLYIGYYHSAKKVGAAHDPMVCFPGQGWRLHGTSTGKLKLSDALGTQLPYATITATLGEQSEHILYWFQAYDEPASSTLMQKILLFKKTLLREGQDNAFVRVSIPCPAQDTNRCEQTLENFVQDFYPPFLRYITSP